MTAPLSIVLPCYNESGNLKSLLSRYRALHQQVPFELILVDNGSTDGTAQLLAAELSQEGNAFTRVVRVEKNIGYGHGIQRGLEAASSEVIAFSHADLECRPEDILEAYRLYKTEATKSACLLKGRRVGPRPYPDRLVTRAYNTFARWMLGMRADVNAQPKLFSRSLLPSLGQAPTGFTFDLFVLFAAQETGRVILEFDVRYDARGWGKSKLAAGLWMRIRTALGAFWDIVQLRKRKSRFGTY